ncbi:hypothetical protein [Planctomicrobium sp. SH527]|uniref:hypothetical protein n=1 Tax=Planctomicrobium sp. SH527 TaxID=3448123 RepID=UPI003F5BC89E
MSLPSPVRSIMWSRSSLLDWRKAESRVPETLHIFWKCSHTFWSYKRLQNNGFIR